MKRLASAAGFAVAVAAAVAACSSTPANVAGDYTIALTNESNSCNLPGFVIGNQTTGVTVTITQSGASVTASVTGLAQLDLNAVLGSNTFSGSIDGDVLDLKITGTKNLMYNSCMYTENADLHATSAGDALSGTVTYTVLGDGSTACSSLTGCTEVQNFNGTRPPM